MLCDDIRYLTDRALWETENLMKCIPNELWDKRYDGIPMWKFLYHTLYSMEDGILIHATAPIRSRPFTQKRWQI